MAKSTTPNADVRLVRSHPTNPILAEAVELPVPYIQVFAPRHISLKGLAAVRIELGATLTMPEGVYAFCAPDAADAHMRGYQITSGVIHSGQEVTLFLRSLTPRAVDFNEGAPIARLYFNRELLSVAVALEG